MKWVVVRGNANWRTRIGPLDPGRVRWRRSGGRLGRGPRPRAAHSEQRDNSENGGDRDHSTRGECDNGGPGAGLDPGPARERRPGRV